VLLRHRGVPRRRARATRSGCSCTAPKVFVAAQAPSDPHVVVEASIVQGGMDDDAKAGFVTDATEAVRQASPDARVWVLVHEIPDGAWGADGRVTRLADAQAILGAD
jgi:phenylpyruvate tautomerase PptA (4-oxalocrotonate tautomerase family)